MRVFNKIYILVLIAIVGTSCKDFLEQPVQGDQTLDNYFKTETECLAAVTGCYNALYGEAWWKMANFAIMSDMCSDDLWAGNTSQPNDRYIRTSHYGNPKQDQDVKNFWQYRYEAIFRCNIVINRLPLSPVQNKELLDRLMAEAKFLRAFNYFELAKNFGGVPIITDIILPDQASGIGRNTLDEVYEVIIADLNDAMALPQKSEYPREDMGRATSGAAKALLAKTYLFKGDFAEAKMHFEELMQKNEYSLLPDFKDVWSVETPNSIESVFEIQFDGSTQYTLGNRLPVLTGSRDDLGWSWGLPTSNLEKAFIDAGDTERLKWTIVKHGDPVAGDPAATSYIITPDKHKSARINRKYYIPQALRPAVYNRESNPLNIRLIRYADVLLMHAEACYETGDETGARSSLNKVRARVNLDEVTATGSDLRKAIRLERRLELALENHRLFDLRRWDDDNGKKALCNVMGPDGSFVKYNLYESTDEFEVSNQKENSNKGINFREDRDLLFPIPHTDVIQSEGAVEQNPNF
ncbi:RagB/SusD family nutrient uptake outer membrane protein [Saccharicrinis aurantiacus]|uniref:RagB/SusD family nutrient uptake outer membrane protein n=1 Tax=Saccharicrinis aurantiacus TaxID=1849719 RepID=UPI0024927990|nr:RagB/SusD family nutrient uptake outer membrane protein [Saccharicrinis aurantiacus]